MLVVVLVVSLWLDCDHCSCFVAFGGGHGEVDAMFFAPGDGSDIPSQLCSLPWVGTAKNALSSASVARSARSVCGAGAVAAGGCASEGVVFG